MKKEGSSMAHEYFRLFKGEIVSRNQIIKEHPYLNITLDVMIEQGSIIGQRTFLNGETELQEDILYIMPGEGGDFNKE